MTHPSQHISKRQVICLFLFSILISLLILPGCSPKNVSPVEDLPPSPILPSPTSEILESPVDETAEPDLDSWLTPTPIPDTWKTFSEESIGIEFRYPPEWTSETPLRLSGGEGFVELSVMNYPTSLFENLKSVCVLEANFINPAVYDTHPFVSTWQGGLVEGQAVNGLGCVVLPSILSSTFPNEAALFARSPSPQMHDQLFVLRVDMPHFKSILSTLRFLDPTTPVPSSEVGNSPACQAALDRQPQIVLNTDGLTVTQIAIANAECNPRDQFDGFKSNLSSIDQEQFGLIWQSRLEQQAEINNQALEPFGYRLSKVEDTSISYDLNKGDQLLVEGITKLGQISVNTSGDDFVMWVQNVKYGKPPIEVRSNAVREIAAIRESDTWNDGFNTTWVGNDLMAYEYISSAISPIAAQTMVRITRNGEAVKIFSAGQPDVSGNTVSNFQSWDGHWLLVMDNVVIQDGQALNQLLDADEIFEWHLVDEKPFFFFLKNGKFGINFADQDLPIVYDDIIHGRLCCEPARYNILSTPSGASFFALQDDVWYLVIVQAE